MNPMVNRLESVLLNIIYTGSPDKQIRPTIDQISDIKAVLNSIFTECECKEFIYTINSDRQFFGVKVYPYITPVDALTILATDEKIMLKDYKVEIDNKVFESLQMSALEVATYILYEINSIVNSYSVIDKVRMAIDGYMISSDDVVSLRDSANHAQLIIFAIKDTLSKVSSVIYNDPETFINDSLIQGYELQDEILNVHEKINGMLISTGEDRASSYTTILKWMFTMYKNMRINSEVIIDTLKNAKLCTGSVLERNEIDMTIKAVNRIDMTIPIDDEKNLQESYTPIGKVFEENNISSLNELSLFKKLKQNGLRGIEDDYYEYAMLMKNMETEDEAIYIMRGISTRLSILEDYIYNTPDLPKYEKEKWQFLAIQFRKLRADMLKQKIWKKSSYGLFFDYNQLPED